MVKFENKGNVKIGDVEMEFTYGMFEGYKVIKDDSAMDIVSRMNISPTESVIVVGQLFHEIPEKIQAVALHREVYHIRNKTNEDVYNVFNRTKDEINAKLVEHFISCTKQNDVDPAEFAADEYAVSKVGREDVVKFLKGLRKFLEFTIDAINKDQNITIPQRDEMIKNSQKAIKEINNRMSKITGMPASSYGPVHGVNYADTIRKMFKSFGKSAEVTI